MPGPTPSAEQLADLVRRLAALESSRDELVKRAEQAERERDEYRRVYVALLEAYRKLEAGLVGQKRERFVGGDEQLTLSVLSMLTGHGSASSEEPAPEPVQKVEAHERRKPTGRKPLPDDLPRVHVEVLPPEVQRAGLDAFDRIGEDTSEVVEFRHASFVVVRTVRPRFVVKGKLEVMAATKPAPVAPDDALIASTPVFQVRISPNVITEIARS